MEAKERIPTQFGKILRKLRVEHDEYAKDMAKRLNVTASYLSSVELGKREIPISWLGILKNDYRLSNDEFINLYEAAYDDKDTVTIRFGTEDRELALTLAREFSYLSMEQKKNLKAILESAHQKNN